MGCNTSNVHGLITFLKPHGGGGTISLVPHGTMFLDPHGGGTTSLEMQIGSSTSNSQIGIKSLLVQTGRPPFTFPASSELSRFIFFMARKFELVKSQCHRATCKV